MVLFLAVSFHHVSDEMKHEHALKNILYLCAKGKSVPRGPRWPESSRKLRFPDYVTMVQNGGKVVKLTHRPFLPTENTPGTHFS